jgi:hypothetical protein
MLTTYINSMLPWALLYQTIGGAVIAPLFYFAYILSSTKNAYFYSGREVTTSYAKAILPSVILAYLVPTFLMYIPWDDVVLLQNLTAFWQFGPLLVNVLMWIFSYALRDPSTTASNRVSGTDIKHLNRIYATSALVTAVNHIGTLYICLTSSNPQLSLSYVFLPNKDIWKTTTALGVHWIFQCDWWGTFVSSFLWCWLSIFDVQRLAGYSSVASVVQAFIIIALSTVVVGPGTMVAGVWYWREAKLVGLERSIGKAKTR